MPHEGDGDQARAYAITAWLIGDTDDAVRNASLHLLGYLLLSQTGSPLRKALLESGLGEDLAGCGMDASGAQADFSTGLRGVRPDDVPRVHALVRDTLARVADEGFNPDAIEAAFNTTEFALRENNTGSSPRGLVVLLRALNHWLHDRSPFVPLRIRPILDEIKRRLAADPGHFQRLLRESILDNPHRVELRVDPDPAIGPRQEAAERDRLAAARAAWRNGDTQAVIDRSHELLRLQGSPDRPEDLAHIPRLRHADLPRDIRRVPQHVHDGGVVHHDLHTHGIWYLDLAFDATDLPDHLVPYLPLFGRCLLEMGTGRRDYVALAEQIGMRTGGITTTCHTGTHRLDGRPQSRLVVRAKVLVEKADQLLDLLEEILHEHLLDPERFRQMAHEEKAGEESDLVPAGHRLARARLKAHHSRADWIGERIDGFEYTRWLRALCRRLDTEWEAVRADLEALRRQVLRRHNCASNSTVDATAWRTLQPRLESFLQRLEPGQAAAEPAWHRGEAPPREALLAPARVNYVGQLVELAPAGWTFDGAQLVVNRHLRNSWLWDEVRVKGGAYGAGCGIDREQGTMLFTSYRDPNVGRTLDTYRRAADFLREQPPGADQVEQAVIGTIGEVDAHRLPDALGYGAFIRHLLGIEDDERQRTRDQILAAGTEDFRRFGEVLTTAFDHSQIAVVGHEECIRAEFGEDAVYTPLFEPSG